MNSQDLEYIYNHNPHIMITLDHAGFIKDVNRAGQLWFGLKPNQLVGESVTKWLNVEIKNIKHHTTLSVSKKIEGAISHRTFSCIEHIVGYTLVEKECREERDRKLSKLADEDPLTNLPNRRYFMGRLEQELLSAKKHSRTLAILFIDLDRFKYVNDTLGHLFGDRVLKQMAERITSIIKINSRQSIVARMGGDEFTVLIPSVDELNDPLHLSEKILEGIREPIEMDGYEFTLTGSVGMSSFPESGTDAESLLTSADAAMYRAKANGTDRVERSNYQMNREFREYFHVENDLRRALERGEFELYFQPQFHTKTGEICGEEVLVRWQHPVHGTVGPGKFISIAEETGLIVPIGEWVLREACRLKQKMLEANYPKVPVSVNLSLKQFLQKNIVETVQEILKETNLPPEFLDLEVTESVSVDLDRTLTILQRLIQLGVRISLDDFGTGYSSLQYVSRLPIHELKIDQSFVRNIGSDPRCEAIISMIVHLGHSLGMKVIAEGVETKEQLAFLKKTNCDFVQGYYYAKPLTSDQYKYYLQE